MCEKNYPLPAPIASHAQTVGYPIHESSKDDVKEILERVVRWGTLKSEDPQLENHRLVAFKMTSNAGRVDVTLEFIPCSLAPTFPNSD